MCLGMCVTVWVCGCGCLPSLYPQRIGAPNGYSTLPLGNLFFRFTIMAIARSISARVSRDIFSKRFPAHWVRLASLRLDPLRPAWSPSGSGLTTGLPSHTGIAGPMPGSEPGPYDRDQSLDATSSDRDSSKVDAPYFRYASRSGTWQSSWGDLCVRR